VRPLYLAALLLFSPSKSPASSYKLQATSSKLQALESLINSLKRQATSFKPQAASYKLLDAGAFIKFFIFVQGTGN
jgi:cell shape-determining protein MreC